MVYPSRLRTLTAATAALTAMLALLAGCGGSGTQVIADDLSGVYIAVLKRYLNSLSERPYELDSPLKLVYILDHTEARPGLDDRRLGPEAPTPIGVEDQQRIVAALSDGRTVRFIANRDDVLEIVDGPAGTSPHPLACRQVRDQGVLITLSPPVGEPDEVRVSIGGHVSCSAATSVMYKVKRGADGWQVTGIDGGVSHI